MRARVVGAALAAALAGACGGRQAAPPGDPEAARVARAEALIEAGNQAFGAGEFSVAAKRYAAAAVSRPEDPAAFFGLGMALARLGRDEEARAAYAKARELTRAQQQP